MRIGVDLGGTNVRVGLVDKNVIVSMISEPCKADCSEIEIIDHIASLIEKLINNDVTQIGIGVPSVVDAKKGIVYDVVSIPSWREVHLKEHMEKRFSIPTYVNNDCNCFALGVYGNLNNNCYKNVMCVALGTGVGAGVIIDGKLYNGNNTGAGEIGNIPYLDRDYEYYCSSRFFIGKGTTGKEAYERARMGDPKALELWQEFGKHIGELVKLILYTYDPEAIIFGGSIASAFDIFNPFMYEELKNFPYSKTVENVSISASNIKDVGLIGAAVCQ